MSSVLAYTSPARGHLFPLVPILDELARRGDRVSVRTLPSQLGLLRARGFEAEPISPEIEAIDLDDWKARAPQGAFKRSVGIFGARAEYEVADLERAIDEAQPDLLLIDVQTWGAAAVAESSGLPWAIWCPYPLPIPSRDAPPFGPGLRPARGPLGRLRDAALSRLFVGSAERLVGKSLDPIRARLDLPPFSGTAEMFAAPPLLLYLTAEPFEYPRSDWPANVRMVGPMSWDPPAEEPVWLGELEEPIVLVSTSSEFQDDGRLVEVALEALAGEDLTVVATLPAADLPRARVPANARVERFVPHGPLLKRAACAVTHGGMGVTQKALAASVPVCAVPFGRDQLEVARRVQVSGAGSRLPASRLNAKRLRRKVLDAMARRPEAERIAAAFEAAGGAPAAGDAVEGLLDLTASVSPDLRA
ncbi:MAG: glycosyltransferase [Solirubrobacterales bacterium]